MYIYSCGQLQWSGPATIGLNTPDDITINHILSGTPIVDNIACIHEDSPWNNLIYDLEMNAVILPETPAPSNFLGKCTINIKYPKLELHVYSTSLQGKEIIIQHFLLQEAVLLLGLQTAVKVSSVLVLHSLTVIVTVVVYFLVTVAVILRKSVRVRREYYLFSDGYNTILILQTLQHTMYWSDMVTTYHKSTLKGSQQRLFVLTPQELWLESTTLMRKFNGPIATI